MNPVLACLYRRDESSLRRLLSGTSSCLSQAHLNEGLRVVLSNTDKRDGYWHSSRVQVAEMLMLAGANVNLYIDEEPILCRMVRTNDTEIVMLLLFHFHCDTDARTKVDGEKDQTALHIAVEQRNEEMLQLLLSNGASANVGDKCGNRPLHLLLSTFNCNDEDNSDSFRKWKNLFVLLLPLTDLSFSNNDGCTVLHAAVISRIQAEFIEQILCSGINVNYRNLAGETAILVACKWGNVEAVKLLLEHDCDASLASFAGDTASHYAAMHCTHGADVMNLLLGKGVNVDLCNKLGQLPIHLSIKSGNVAVTQLLIFNNCNIKKVGVIIYDSNLNILTLDNGKLRNSVYDAVSRFWCHLDFVELSMLVTSGCQVHIGATDIIKQMALDVLTRTPMNWRNSLYGIKKGYNLQTLILAAETLHVHISQPSRLQHLCRLSLRKTLEEMQNSKHIVMDKIGKHLGLPDSLWSYVRIQSLCEIELPRASPV